MASSWVSALRHIIPVDHPYSKVTVSDEPLRPPRSCARNPKDQKRVQQLRAAVAARDEAINAELRVYVARHEQRAAISIMTLFFEIAGSS